MKNKKFISLVLALAMVFSMSVSVFASGGAAATPAADPNTFTATAEVKIPPISVTVPSTQPLFINPMGFSVNIADGSAAAADATEGITSNKVVSPVFEISNASPMKLDVGVIASAGTVSLAAGSTATAPTMSIASAPIADGDTKNSVFIYANFGTPDNDGVLAEVPYDAEKAATLAVTPKAPKDPTIVGTVNPGDGTDPTVFGFQFLGDCNANAKNEWTPGEKVTVTLVFSFKPNLSSGS